MTRRSGLPAFVGWTAVGACGALGLAAAPSFGLVVLPFAVVAIAIAARTLRTWPEGLGAIAGVGVLLLVIALLNSDYRSCSEGPVTAAAGDNSVSCGGLDPIPLLVVGVVLCFAAGIGYAALNRRAS
jgi:hypothetical protein